MQSQFAQRLESLRGSLTQRQFANMLGVPLTSYTNWLAGISTPKIDVVITVCSKLGVSADWLLGLTDSSTGADAVVKFEGLREELKAILEKYSS